MSGGFLFLKQVLFPSDLEKDLSDPERWEEDAWWC